MTSRQALHAMVDKLPEGLFAVAEASLLRLDRLQDDPFWRDLAAAPESDEPLSDADLEAIETGWKSFAAGKSVADDTLDALLA